MHVLSMFYLYGFLFQNLVMQHVDHSGGVLIHLLQGLLRYDPLERLTAREALRHPFFTQDHLRRWLFFVWLCEKEGTVQARPGKQIDHSENQTRLKPRLKKLILADPNGLLVLVLTYSPKCLMRISFLREQSIKLQCTDLLRCREKNLLTDAVRRCILLFVSHFLVYILTFSDSSRK